MKQDENSFFSHPLNEQLRLIDQLLERAIMPRLRADGGGIQMMGLDGKTLYLHYTGACHGCHYSTTSTLTFIREILHSELSPEIEIELS